MPQLKQLPFQPQPQPAQATAPVNFRGETYDLETMEPTRFSRLLDEMAHYSGVLDTLHSQGKLTLSNHLIQSHHLDLMRTGIKAAMRARGLTEQTCARCELWRAMPTNFIICDECQPPPTGTEGKEK